jgi:polyhydroxybutyrate depolymerase
MHTARNTLAGVLALALLLGPAAPVRAAATEAGAMVNDLLDSLTAAPSSGKNAHAPTRKASGGPSAPTAPKAPSVAAPRVQAPAAPISPGLAQAGSTAPRAEVLALRHGGVERRALVFRPSAPPSARTRPAPPLLVFLHGAGGSAAQALRQTAIAARAAAAGMLVAVPEGLGPPPGSPQAADGQTWNAWMCCGYARDEGVDDVGFLAALIDRLRRDYPLDARRIYLAGFSNGAMLADRFALERPGIAAALALVGGSIPCDAPAPARALPVLVIHGALDEMARFNPTRAHPATGKACEDHPARAQVDHWVRGMRLNPKPAVRDAGSSPVRIEDYTAQAKGAPGFVRFVIVKNGGHAWPGGARERYRYCDMPTASPDATAMVLGFFLHPPRQL